MSGNVLKKAFCCYNCYIIQLLPKHANGPTRNLGNDIHGFKCCHPRRLKTNFLANSLGDFFGLFKAIFGRFFKTTGILSYFFPRMPMVQQGISVMSFTAVNDATLVVFKNKWINVCCFLALQFALLQHSSQLSHIFFPSSFFNSGPQKNSFISKIMSEIKNKFIAFIWLSLQKNVI